MPQCLLRRCRVRPSHLVLAAAFAATAGCAAHGASTERGFAPQAIEADHRGDIGSSVDPTAAELRYIRQTARTIYRGQPIERMRSFLPFGNEGYRICVRTRRNGTLDHTLFTLQRRIDDDFISQAADDVLIDRSSAGTAICRDPQNAWISVR